jgi:hypothetical protein
MSNAITGLIDGTQTAQEAFANMFAQIGKAFIDMATQMIAKALILKALGALTGGLGGGGGGGGGGIAEGLLGGATGNLGNIQFAEGGYVTGPTNATVGEGGEPEFVIPQSKMSGAMERWNAGARGEEVIPGGADSGGESGGGGGGLGTIDVAYNVQNINSVSYVTEAEFQQGMAQAAKQGGELGQMKALGKLRNSPATRRRLGL